MAELLLLALPVVDVVDALDTCELDAEVDEPSVWINKVEEDVASELDEDETTDVPESDELIVELLAVTVLVRLELEADNDELSALELVVGVQGSSLSVTVASIYAVPVAVAVEVMVRVPGTIMVLTASTWKICEVI